ncbi:hypothetical protein MCM1_1972 [Methanosarcina barkeri CM1]|uniref:Uncharacterized protein n=1 Tax=Methanosarcina barkeri CM1 TaxID=796385 RepID=A0A0G3CAG4_METBA|nr:hypothetical protein MCM1_1972 [Methanosarcina barkeri CM1]
MILIGAKEQSDVSNIYQIYIKYISNIYQIYIKYISNIYQIYIKFEEVLCHRQIDNFTNRKYVIENVFLG